jgi:flagellar hook-length control protein FliK
MNINLINDLNLTPSHQSQSVETDVIASDSDGFQQLLQQSEKQSQQGKKIINAELNVIDDTHEDHDADMIIMAINPFYIQTIEQEKQDVVSAAQNSEAKTKPNLSITNPLNTAILEADVFDNLSSETLINDQPTQLLASIYDSENLINKATQQTDAMPLSDNHQAIATDLVHKKATRIKNDVSNTHFNQTNNPQNASDIRQKAMADQTPFITNNDDQGAILHINPESALTTHANGQNALLPSANASTTSATLNMSMQANTTQWQNSLTEQIIMFNRQGIQSANINLHPQELGSLHIKLAMSDDKMNLHMMAAHGVVKGLLESALPFLKTSLAEQGITLEQADIGDFSMMSDSQQSAMYQQTQHNQSHSALTLDSETNDINVEQIRVENSPQKSALSIFA